ncbi:ABC transporter substrate-binding protein [Cnuibacter physcomitrellae]|uniref:ABC transporter substrate-binding protein n=1 Tax=Cnuibacter physcomitrellae TaxID=1619308 RepID=UPI0021759EFF|nr:ABC transporter substrate-binding protein [Cnuibacter physcomitrellae]MCS5497118.1 ABC transporter substrate-binding protein [Cnuibacter physcomitrellae]
MTAQTFRRRSRRHPSAPTAGIAVLLAAATAAVLSGCGTAPGSDSAGAATPDQGFPVTISNCGTELTLDHRPERIVLVNDDSLANLEALGAVDRVVGITARPAPGLYEQSTYDTLARLETMSTEKNSTGGSIVSQESILGAEPDLVISPENAVDRAALAAAGVAVYTPTAYCSDPPSTSGPATFDRVWSELRDYGAILGETERSDELVDELTETVSAPAASAGTAAAVYVSSGGTVLSPYGAQSMVTPVFEAAGLTNVYADVDQRVFDVNVEDLVSRDPETVVVLYSSGDGPSAVASFTSAPGTQSLSAVRNGRVVALPFPYTDPPSVLSVRGPAQLEGLLTGLR